MTSVGPFEMKSSPACGDILERGDSSRLTLVVLGYPIVIEITLARGGVVIPLPQLNAFKLVLEYLFKRVRTLDEVHLL